MIASNWFYFLARPKRSTRGSVRDEVQPTCFWISSPFSTLLCGGFIDTLSLQWICVRQLLLPFKLVVVRLDPSVIRFRICGKLEFSHALPHDDIAIFKWDLLCRTLCYYFIYDQSSSQSCCVNSIKYVDHCQRDVWMTRNNGLDRAYIHESS